MNLHACRAPSWMSFSPSRTRATRATDRVCKEQLLYGAAHARDVGDDQPAPKAVIAEGIATNALDIAIGRMGSPAVLKVLSDPGNTVGPAGRRGRTPRRSGRTSSRPTLSAYCTRRGSRRRWPWRTSANGRWSAPDRAAKTVEWLLDPGFVGRDHGVREGEASVPVVHGPIPRWVPKAAHRAANASSLLEPDA